MCQDFDPYFATEFDLKFNTIFIWAQRTLNIDVGAYMTASSSISSPSGHAGSLLMPTKWHQNLETAPHPYPNPGADSTFSILLTVSLEDETRSLTRIVVHRQRVTVDVIDGERIVKDVSHVFTDTVLFEEYKCHVDSPQRLNTTLEYNPSTTWEQFSQNCK